MRWASLVAIVVVAVLGVAASASGAKGGVHATLTSRIPADKSGGDHVRISWKLRDSAGRPVSLERVVVKIVCPTGTDFTTAVATPVARGRYLVVAVVPPGGIGTVSLRTRGSVIPITNPFRR